MADQPPSGFRPPSGTRPPSGVRPPPRDVVELRALAERQPELATAANLHAELVEAVRRVQLRISTPWVESTSEDLSTRLSAGAPLITFEQVAFDWPEVRLLFRQVTDILRRYEAVDAETSARLHDIGRSPELGDRVRAWFSHAPGGIEMLDETLAWAVRPYMVRAAEVLQQRMAIDKWRGRRCPVCASEPEFAVVTVSGDRQLLCPRCQTRWPADSGACALCGAADPRQVRTLTTADGHYRVASCTVCGRYLKMLDSRKAGRPLLAYFDPIATLPLDAAMMKRSGQ
jgi:formate dehydrogenase maturation protein FdhE